MPGGLFAGGEMMMVPAFRRHEQTSRPPVDPNKFAAWRPHQRITFAGNNNHLCPRAMAMSFFVSAGFDSHDMADHGVTGKMNTQTTKTDTSLWMIIELDRHQVRNKINRAVFDFCGLQFAAEEVSLPGEAIAKFVSDVENKVRGIVKVHYQGQIIGGGETNWLGGRTVVVLMLDVKRRREKAAGLPLECYRILGRIAPELGRAAP